MVWFLHFFPCGHPVSAAGLLYDLLRPRAGKQSAIRRSSPSKEFDPCEIGRLLPRPYLSSAASISSASRNGLSPSYSILVSGRRRGGSPLVAEAVFVECGANPFGQPKWVVAVIFDTGVRVPTWW